MRKSNNCMKINNYILIAVATFFALIIAINHSKYKNDYRLTDINVMKSIL